MITAPTGVLLPTIEPGTPEWLSRMSASKIAAVLGLSPYESRFSLWHRMAGLVPPEEQTDEMSRGHYLEPACAAWFADQHPEWQITPAGTFVHATDDKLAATPDRLVTCDTGEVRLLECKTEGDADKWGTPGTDEIPIYYRAQGQWQMHVTGLRWCHFAVLSKYLVFQEYVMAYDAADATLMVDGAHGFLDTLPGGPKAKRPDLDAHTATYQVVRELHPQINGEDFDVPPDLAWEFCGAQHQLKAAKATEQAARTKLADAMGEHKRARFDGQTIADRRTKAGGTPYLQAASRLPALPSDTKAA